MKERFRKRLSLIMALVIVVTLLSQMRVSVYAETASLTNLGYLGTVNIGQKTESGMWYKLYIEDTPVFCMDLGKACHSGDTYKKISTSTVSSDSTDLSTVIKAKAGYWYYVTENESNKAWIIAQCLLWASEEGAASKTELIDIIGQIKDNAGYKTKTSQQLYDSIFANKEKVTCTVTKWESSSEYRQVLLQIKSGDKVPVKPKYHKVNREAWFRQRLTINKCAENGAPLETVKFKLTALNYKEMYSYYVEGHNTVSGAGDKDGFEMIGETDKNGMLGFRFTYRIQSKDFYYYNDEDLKNLSESDKVKLKKELDEKGYEYADSLTKTDAHILMDRDLNNQKDKINNSYLLEEISSGDSNISIAPEIISPAENSHGKVTRLSPTSFKIVLKNSWWRNDDKTWSDDKEGMNFQGAFLIVAVNKLKKVQVNIEKRDSDTKENTAQGDALLDGAVYMLKGANNAKIYNEKGEETGDMERYIVKDGIIKLGYLECGKEYLLREVEPPVGYLLDETEHKIKVKGDKYTNVLNIEKTPVDISYEKVIKGRIEIIKFLEDTTLGARKPEANAEFQIYLESKGNYEDSKDNERDLITTDSTGYAITKELPFGTYVVHQTKGEKWADYIEDFKVQIVKDGKIYSYRLNDTILKSYLRITKKDVNTKKTVLKPGTVYQIYSLDENGKETLIEQKYSEGDKIVTTNRFTSDESGMIKTYEELLVGKYRIKEIQSAEGYYNAKEYVDIEITKQSYKVEHDKDGNTYHVAEAEYENSETYGRITLEKYGEVLKDIIIRDDGSKKFIYEEDYLKGVVFEIYAEENVATQDNHGTCWFYKGDKVATVTTGTGAEFVKTCSGICGYYLDKDTGAVTIYLPLGKYRIREVKTAYGYILENPIDRVFEFKWNNQDEAYVYDSLGIADANGVIKIINDRARADIKIVKKNSETNLGIKNTIFGLYTKNNIYAADGRLLMNAGELITKVTTEKNGYAFVDTDLPLMSLGYQNVEEDDEALNRNNTLKYNDEENNNPLNSSNYLNSGNYYFVEESVSESYYINQKEIDIHLEYKDAYTPVIHIEKEHANSQVEVEIDKLTLAENKELADCSLTIIDNNRNRIISWVTGRKGSEQISLETKELGYEDLKAEMNEDGNLIIKGLLHDMEYTLIETKPADGYVSAESIDFCLKEERDEQDNVNTAVYTKNKNNEYERASENKVIMKDDVVKVSFTKISSDKGKLLGGAEYKVYDSYGNQVYSFISSDKKPVMIEGVFKVHEKYRFVETKAPKGYKKALDLVIDIKDISKVQKFKVADEKEDIVKKTNPTIYNTPQTGIKRDIFASMVFMMVSGIICYCAFPGKNNSGKKKKKS